MNLTKPFRAVLFDLDGTLVDTAPDFIRIIRNLAAENKLEQPSDAKIREQVSAGSRAMVSLLLPESPHQPEEQAKRLRDDFLMRYAEKICVDSRLYPGFDEILDRLDSQNLPWGVVTNKPRQLSEKLLSELKLSKRCRVLVCPDDVTHAKPDPEPLHLAAKQLGLDNESIIYVGDHPRDIDAGNAAGMTTVLAAYGYLPPKSDSAMPLDYHADHVVDSGYDLIKLLWQNDANNITAKSV